MKHVAFCSFGKDSIATILLALEKGEPLDEIVYCEVMFDHARNISGEYPEHARFIYDTAIPYFEKRGLKVRVLRSEKDYRQLFFTKLTKSKISERNGKLRSFPISGRCKINSDCKIAPIRKYKKQAGEMVEYVGIAIDEPKRLARLHGKKNKISLLEQYNVTEQMAKEMCERENLLSPIYKTQKRNGCWFCMNQRQKNFEYLYRYEPHLWQELKTLSQTPNLVSDKFKYNYTIADIEKRIEQELFYQFKLF